MVSGVSSQSEICLFLLLFFVEFQKEGKGPLKQCIFNILFGVAFIICDYLCVHCESGFEKATHTHQGGIVTVWWCCCFL